MEYLDIAACSTGLNVDVPLFWSKLQRNMTTTADANELWTYAANTAASMALVHPDYSTFGGRLARQALDMRLPTHVFSEAVCGPQRPFLDAKFVAAVEENAAALDAMVAGVRVEFDLFGFRTVEGAYLIKADGRVLETPEMMYARVAVGLHGSALDAVRETFTLLVQRKLSHATPTMFNAGSRSAQLSSCFLLDMKADSIVGIYDTLKQCALVSKYAGGIGLAIHKIRAAGSRIRGTMGHSNGLVPMMRVFSDTARYVDQGGGRRKGSIATFLEPWHADIHDWLQLRKQVGKEELRARDVNLGLWVPDLFMRRVQAKDGMWSLFCPDEAPGLCDVHSGAFEALYTRYEAEGRARRVVKAVDLFHEFLDMQIETGEPYLMFKDACNRLSNQQHLGTIKSSNLCTEIVQFTDPDNTAVCNLSAVILDSFVSADGTTFDFDDLQRVVAVAVRNMNRIIDVNYYPITEAQAHNTTHRPVGLGVIGLADAFARMGMAYGDERSRVLNRQIFETMYFAAASTSHALALEFGPHASFKGSPMAAGKFQFDLKNVAVSDERHNWTGLREAIVRDGIRNSLLIALMPTASTAQITGRSESFEPITNTMFSRRVLAGDFTIVNRHMVRELEGLGLWTPEIRSAIVGARGSLQKIDAIPPDVRERFRTVWEIPHRTVLELAIDRSPFVCQSQSLNVHMADPTREKLSGNAFMAWRHEQKTAQYYLRRQPVADALQFAHLMDAPAVTEEPSCLMCSA